jgi:CRISPR-associated protein Cmr2
MLTRSQNISIALTWCLAYGDPKAKDINPLRKALQAGHPVPTAWSIAWKAIETFNNIPSTIPDSPSAIAETYPALNNPDYKIGLVYGGATKIKQYVFETENLQDIRGASAILDQINLRDLPAFFNPNDKSPVNTWLKTHFPELKAALIPELIIYSTGGNILALCPAPYIDQLANAIERYYTETTLTANSCAVGDTFQLLELKFGLLSDPIETTPWLDRYQEIHNLESSTTSTTTDLTAQFQQRKNFNELVTHLTSQFNHRRNGNLTDQRSHRRYPPMYETHPYIQRDDSGLRSTIDRITQLPSQPKFSEASARKRLVGQITKREVTGEWIQPLSPKWQPGKVSSWVTQFLAYLDANDSLYRQYFKQGIRDTSEARSLPEIGQASDPRGYVAYIYADGNNMGQYIQREIRSPQAYQEFSEDIFYATQHAVYRALAQHLKPTQIQRETTPGQPSTIHIHPFEIIAIGGDDVFLVVPADQALAIAKSIGEEFEKILLEVEDARYQENTTYQPAKVHRCDMRSQTVRQSKLSLSTGVLIAAENIPVYYAQKLVEQLLKSAKKRAKLLKKNHYFGGTVDFLVMKAVTMVSSDLNEFRQQARTKVSSNQQQILKLYGAPYTLHELGTLLATSQAIKQSKFPKNQLYQIRSFLEQGKQTAILNYRYFQARLSGNNADNLKTSFDNTWCQARSNGGNIAPWISRLTTEDSDINIPEASTTTEPKQKSTYETIWWDLVDLYPFTSDPNQSKSANIPPPSARNSPSPNPNPSSNPSQKGQSKPKNTPSKYS